MRTQLTPTPDVSVASWLAPRLGPFGRQVGSFVPHGFEAYARILHPVPRGPDAWATWADVCAAGGRRPHALMQWDTISRAAEERARSAGPSSHPWVGEPPEPGNLDSAALTALCDVLARHTRPGEGCVFALWDGYGWIQGTPSVVLVDRRTPIPPALPQSVLDGPRLHLPGRDYLLFTGTLPAAASMGWHAAPECFVPQSPNLFWPHDRSWCVATEIDLDSTVVAGTNELVRAVLAASGLEAWPVAADDSLSSDSDRGGD